MAGFNDNGVCISINALTAAPSPPIPGVGASFISRSVLDSTSLHDAVRRATDIAEMGGGLHFNIGCTKNDVCNTIERHVSVEVSPFGASVLVIGDENAAEQCNTINKEKAHNNSVKGAGTIISDDCIEGSSFYRQRVERATMGNGSGTSLATLQFYVHANHYLRPVKKTKASQKELIQERVERTVSELEGRSGDSLETCLRRVQTAHTLARSAAIPAPRSHAEEEAFAKIHIVNDSAAVSPKIALETLRAAPIRAAAPREKQPLAHDLVHSVLSSTDDSQFPIYRRRSAGNDETTVITHHTVIFDMIQRTCKLYCDDRVTKCQPSRVYKIQPSLCEKRVGNKERKNKEEGKEKGKRSENGRNGRGRMG